MAQAICPCKDCYNRTITCHGVCEGYQAWKAERDEMNTNLRKAYESQYTCHPNKAQAIRMSLRRRK